MTLALLRTDWDGRWLGSACRGATPAGETRTTTLLSSASPGAGVCLNSGSRSPITLSGIATSSPGVTLAATPGQTVDVPGFTVTGSNTRNFIVEGFSIMRLWARGLSPDPPMG